MDRNIKGLKTCILKQTLSKKRKSAFFLYAKKGDIPYFWIREIVKKKVDSYMPRQQKSIYCLWVEVKTDKIQDEL